MLPINSILALPNAIGRRTLAFSPGLPIKLCKHTVLHSGRATDQTHGWQRNFNYFFKYFCLDSIRLQTVGLNTLNKFQLSRDELVTGKVVVACGSILHKMLR